MSIISSIIAETNNYLKETWSKSLEVEIDKLKHICELNDYRLDFSELDNVIKNIKEYKFSE